MRYLQQCGTSDLNEVNATITAAIDGPAHLAMNSALGGH
jgi:hypothetical protein